MQLNEFDSLFPQGSNKDRDLEDFETSSSYDSPEDRGVPEAPLSRSMSPCDSNFNNPMSPSLYYEVPELMTLLSQATIPPPQKNGPCLGQQVVSLQKKPVPVPVPSKNLSFQPSLSQQIINNNKVVPSFSAPIPTSLRPVAPPAQKIQQPQAQLQKQQQQQQGQKRPAPAPASPEIVVPVVDSEEEERRRLKRQKNNEAAQKCRLKKKLVDEENAEKSKVLEAENAMLRKELERLQTETKCLKEIILTLSANKANS